MRTLSEMRANLRALVVDPSSDEFTDSQLDDFLERAADLLWDTLLASSDGRRLLRVRSAPAAVVANYDEYELPSDCLQLEAVEARKYTTKYGSFNCGAAGDTTPSNWAAVTDGKFRIRVDSRVYDVTSVDFTGDTTMDNVAATIQAAVRAVTGGGETCTWDSTNTRFQFAAYDRIGWLYSCSQDGTELSGSSWMNGQRDSGTPALITGAPDFYQLAEQVPTVQVYNRSSVIAQTHTAGGSLEAWEPVDEHVVRLHPLVTTADAIYRFVYCRRPAFPSNDGDTITDIPDGADSLIEYAASMLAVHEELEDDGVPAILRVVPNTYNVRLRAWLSGRGGGAIRRKRHVHLVE